MKRFKHGQRLPLCSMAARTHRVHLSKICNKLLWSEPDAGRLVTHVSRDFTYPVVAIVDRRLPDVRVGLLLADEGDNVVIFVVREHDPPTCRPVLLFQITVGLPGRGRNRQEVANDIRRGIGRRRGKAGDLRIDHISVFIHLPKDDVSVPIGERVARTKLDEMLARFVRSGGSFRAAAVGRETRLGTFIFRLARG